MIEPRFPWTKTTLGRPPSLQNDSGLAAARLLWQIDKILERPVPKTMKTVTIRQAESRESVWLQNEIVSVTTTASVSDSLVQNPVQNLVQIITKAGLRTKIAMQH